MDPNQFPEAYKNYLSLLKEISFRYVSITAVLTYTEIRIVEKAADSCLQLIVESWRLKNVWIKCEHPFQKPEYRNRTEIFLA